MLLVHHPLQSDSRPKRLTDSRQLLTLLKRHGVELVLHGHDHIHSTMWFDGPDGKIPGIGVPAASALARGRGARAQVVRSLGDVVPAMLAGVTAVGVAESTSASPALAAQLTGALSGLGPLSVLSRRVSTEIVGAPDRTS